MELLTDRPPNVKHSVRGVMAFVQTNSHCFSIIRATQGEVQPTEQLLSTYLRSYSVNTVQFYTCD